MNRVERVSYELLYLLTLITGLATQEKQRTGSLVQHESPFIPKLNVS